MCSPPLRCSISSPPPPPSDADESSSSRKPWLLVGLGNPGKIYQGTRHNVGFEMLDAIAEAEGISVSSIKFKAIFGKGYIGNAPIMLAKPQTFMNASGESVAALVSYFNIPLNQVLLMYDDMDLPFAKLRLLPKGGHGGHNGYEPCKIMEAILHVWLDLLLEYLMKKRQRTIVNEAYLSPQHEKSTKQDA